MRKITILFKEGGPVNLEADMATFNLDGDVLILSKMVGDGPTTSPATEELAQFNWDMVIGYFWAPDQHEEA